MLACANPFKFKLYNNAALSCISRRFIFVSPSSDSDTFQAYPDGLVKSIPVFALTQTQNQEQSTKSQKEYGYFILFSQLSHIKSFSSRSTQDRTPIPGAVLQS